MDMWLFDTGVAGHAVAGDSLGRCSGRASKGDTTPTGGDADAPATLVGGWVPQAQRTTSATTAGATAIRHFITATTPDGLPPLPRSVGGPVQF